MIALADREAQMTAFLVVLCCLAALAILVREVYSWTIKRGRRRAARIFEQAQATDGSLLKRELQRERPDLPIWDVRRLGGGGHKR